jgi:type I restriction enzyme, S subunit
VVNFVMPVPPVSEQQEIAKRMSATTAAIDALINKANEVIDTLREYRSALINDAVTGKIDVWGVA